MLQDCFHCSCDPHKRVNSPPSPSFTLYSSFDTSSSTHLQNHKRSDLLILMTGKSRMKASVVIPSLLAFGPGTELPSQEVIAELRQELIENPYLSNLRDAVKDLPRFWRTLIDFDPSLSYVPGGKYLDDLQWWVADAGAFHHSLSNTPNVYALPVSLIIQITQYFRFLNLLGKKEKHPHCRVLEGLRAGGIQGFCIGFLSAIAVSTSENEMDITTVAAVSLRLAVCIGVYVDQDGSYAKQPNHMACVSIRWRTDAFSKKEVSNFVRTYADVSQGSIVLSR